VRTVAGGLEAGAGDGLLYQAVDRVGIQRPGRSRDGEMNLDFDDADHFLGIEILDAIRNLPGKLLRPA
jgi:hypothetical protein